MQLQVGRESPVQSFRISKGRERETLNLFTLHYNKSAGDLRCMHFFEVYISPPTLLSSSFWADRSPKHSSHRPYPPLPSPLRYPPAIRIMGFGTTTVRGDRNKPFQLPDNSFCFRDFAKSRKTMLQQPTVVLWYTTYAIVLERPRGSSPPVPTAI